MATKWDYRFLRLAREVSTWSQDPSTKVGAVLVAPDHSVISLGFNGFPRQMEDKPEWYADRTEKYSRIVHAEINALIQAERRVLGSTLYTWPFVCCDRCAVQMIQAGVSAFVYPAPQPDALKRWKESFDRTHKFFDEMQIWYEQVPREEIE